MTACGWTPRVVSPAYLRDRGTFLNHLARPWFLSKTDRSRDLQPEMKINGEKYVQYD